MNNHQVTFCKQVAERNGNILVAESVDELGAMIRNYGDLVAGISTEMKSNNLNFCTRLRELVREIL